MKCSNEDKKLTQTHDDQFPKTITSTKQGNLNTIEESLIKNIKES